jgi:hypothetical protein
MKKTFRFTLAGLSLAVTHIGTEGRAAAASTKLVVTSGPAR